MEKWETHLTVKIFLPFAEEESKNGTQCQEGAFSIHFKSFLLLTG